MKLAKVDPTTTAALTSAVLYAGAAAIDDVSSLVRDPRAALAGAGVDVPADRDVTVRVDRSGSRALPEEADDERGGPDGGVVVVVIDDGRTVVVIVIVSQ